MGSRTEIGATDVVQSSLKPPSWCSSGKGVRLWPSNCSLEHRRARSNISAWAVFNATGPGSVVEMQHSSAIAMDLVAAITSKKEKSQTHESASVSAPSSLLSLLHQNLVEENLIEAVEVLQIPQHDWQPLARRRQCQELINLAPHHSATSHHGGGDQRPR